MVDGGAACISACRSRLDRRKSSFNGSRSWHGAFAGAGMALFLQPVGIGPSHDGCAGEYRRSGLAKKFERQGSRAQCTAGRDLTLVCPRNQDKGQTIPLDARGDRRVGGERPGRQRRGSLAIVERVMDACPTSRWCRPLTLHPLPTRFSRCDGTSASRWTASVGGGRRSPRGPVTPGDERTGKLTGTAVGGLALRR